MAGDQHVYIVRQDFWSDDGGPTIEGVISSLDKAREALAVLVGRRTSNSVPYFIEQHKLDDLDGPVGFPYEERK